MTERTGGGIDTDNLVGIQMDTHFGVGQVEGLELFHIIPAVVAQHRRIRDARVTLTENEAVAVFPLGVFFFRFKYR